MSIEKTKHINICAEIRTGILEGDINGRLKSIRELAEEYGVASVTMRKALDTLKDEGLLEARPGVGTFVLPPETKTTGLIGLVLERGLRHMSHNFYAMSVLMGIQQALSEAGFSLLFTGTPEEVLEKGNSRKVDGFCLYEVFDREFPRLIKGLGAVVAVEGCLTDGSFDTVHLDNLDLGKKAARKIIDIGSSHVLYLGVDKGRRKDPAWVLREKGFREVMDNKDSINVTYMPLSRSPSVTPEELDTLLDERKEYDAAVINGGYPGASLLERSPDLDPEQVVVMGSLPDAQLLKCNVIGGDFFDIGFEAGTLMIRRLRNPDAAYESRLVEADILRDKKGVRWPYDPAWDGENEPEFL